MNLSKKQSLRRIVLEDIKSSSYLGSRNIISWLIDRFGTGPAGWLAEILARIDEQLEEASLNETAIRATYAFSEGLVVTNQEAVPETGPLLVVANHPGLIDILGVLACIKREDVKIVAQQKGFKRVLRNINRHMLTLVPGSTFKLEAIREIIQALNDKNAVIIFPKGLLEPDPAVMAGAAESLQNWSDSIGAFLNKVPETQLLPVLVSGIVTERAWNSWFAKLGPTPKRRQQFAITAQFVMQRLSKKPHRQRPLHIDIGQAKFPHELDPSLDPRKPNLAVKQEMLSLLEQAYPSQGLFGL